jgi:SAM-dependent methyltransferase
MFQRLTCPITQSSDLVTKIELPYASGLLGPWTAERRQQGLLSDCSFVILHNPAIEFYFQRWVFDQEDEVKRRENIAARSANLKPKLYSLTELSHKAEDAITIRLLFPELDRPPRVLDYGMATGEWLLMARAYGAEAWGTDIDPRAAIAAAQSGLGYAAEHELPDGYFDFINADQVFEHLPDPLATISDLARKLATGGFLKLSTPGDDGIERKLGRLRKGDYTLTTFKQEFSALAPLSHINLFTAKSLTALAAKAGLESYRLPLKTTYAAMTGFHSARQLNRNLYSPFKRHMAAQTWQYFRFIRKVSAKWEKAAMGEG